MTLYVEQAISDSSVMQLLERLIIELIFISIWMFPVVTTGFVPTGDKWEKKVNMSVVTNGI